MSSMEEQLRDHATCQIGCIAISHLLAGENEEALDKVGLAIEKGVDPIDLLASICVAIEQASIAAPVAAAALRLVNIQRMIQFDTQISAMRATLE